MLCLSLLCGLPASGKSTLCKNLTKNSDEKIAYFHIPFDNLLPDIDYSVPSNYLTWKQHRKSILEEVVNLLNALKNQENYEHTESYWQKLYIGMKNCHSVNVVLLIDDNMHYRGMRKEWYNLACRYNVGFCTIFIECHVTTCIQQNLKRSKPVATTTIQKMAKQIEKPGTVKNNWENLYLFLNFENVTLDCSTPINKINGLITEACFHPVAIPEISKEAEYSRDLCCKNFKHQLDLIVRKNIHASMAVAKQNLSRRDLGIQFRKLNEAKINVIDMFMSDYLNHLDFINTEGDIIIELLELKVAELMNDFAD